MLSLLSIVINNTYFSTMPTDLKDCVNDADDCAGGLGPCNAENTNKCIDKYQQGHRFTIIALV